MMRMSVSVKSIFIFVSVVVVLQMLSFSASSVTVNRISDTDNVLIEGQIEEPVEGNLFARISADLETVNLLMEKKEYQKGLAIVQHNLNILKKGVYPYVTVEMLFLGGECCFNLNKYAEAKSFYQKGTNLLTYHGVIGDFSDNLAVYSQVLFALGDDNQAYDVISGVIDSCDSLILTLINQRLADIEMGSDIRNKKVRYENMQHQFYLRKMELEVQKNLLEKNENILIWLTLLVIVLFGIVVFMGIKYNNQLAVSGVLEQRNREITQRRMELEVAKEEAEKSEALKRSFLNNLTSEIRTPLQVLAGISEILHHEDKVKGEYVDLVRLIKYSGKELLDYVEEIVDVSKIDSGQIVLELTECQLEPFIQNIMGTIEGLEPQRKVYVAFSGLDEFRENNLFYTDVQRFGVVLRKWIEFVLDISEDLELYVKVEMKDNGQVVQVEVEMKKIGKTNVVWSKNERFAHVEKYAYSVIRKMLSFIGGTCRFDVINQGARVSLFVPNRKKGQKALSDSETSVVQWTEIKVWIMFSDDENFEAVKTVLRGLGVRVLRVDGGDDVLSRFSEFYFPDVLLIDECFIDEENEIMKEIMTMGDRFIAIVQTEKLFAMGVENMVQDGFVHYLLKPNDASIMPYVLSSYLKNSVENE